MRVMNNLINCLIRLKSEKWSQKEIAVSMAEMRNDHGQIPRNPLGQKENDCWDSTLSKGFLSLEHSSRRKRLLHLGPGT